MNGLQLIGIENQNNLLLVGYLRNQPAEPTRKKGQMRYKIEITFDASKELSNEEMAWLEDSLVLQLLEPVDVDSNNCDWKSFNIRMDLQKEVEANV
jgi:hypothetical protein